MSRSERMKKVFEKCRAAGRPAFIAYITAGDPNYDTSLQVVDTLVDAGVDILEMGVPFADPLADGPTNQEAAQRALDAGMTTVKTFEMIKEIRKKHADLPIVLYTYLNSLIHHGDFEKSCKDTLEAGADAFLLLDLPPGEGPAYREILDKENVGLVTLVAPTTGEHRLPVIAETASEFVYYVSQVGVTGVRQNLATDMSENIATIKKHAKTPVVVGFGISQPEHVKEIKNTTNVDGIVVGSAIVKRIAAIATGEGSLEELGAFVKSLTEACV